MSSPEPSLTPRGKIFVTGGSGHVGANLVRRLLADGHELRCLVVPGGDTRPFDGLDVEVVEGDIRDADAMRTAIAGCTRVFHVAAKVSILSPSAKEYKDIFSINVLGTKNVMRAALENGVEKAVLTGSFSAVGYDPDDPSKPSTDDMPHWPYDDHVLPYARSKALAEHEMLKVVVDGLDASIATSCSCIGPHDWIPSRMGRTMCDFANGKLRAYVPGGFEFVASRDIVDGHVRTMAAGRRGQKYVFATGFHTLGDLIDMWREIVGVRARPRKIPAGLMSAFSSVYSGALSKFFPNVPQRLTPGSIRILQMQRRADTSKARTELGWRPTDVPSAMREAYEFFANVGMISRDVLVQVPRSSPPTSAAAE
ncbi:MAG TPA: NAD-dependent epimerase/dehydratase family protein [Nannocystaceae bacterium]|nr:NAD-dependent epimerase/dehydratase family protein [Nannocystaceae bacterium]